MHATGNDGQKLSQKVTLKLLRGFVNSAKYQIKVYLEECKMITSFVL